ncbi:MAG: IspD/TarI family cytidylyltransferase [Eubacteriales bacterium]|nr:IspD/TarI family cytidylyltransferase [Eubacteriales bacterium]
MNLAVIFAGGSGKRMNAKDRPKQFLFVHGKPIIVHTIEIFNSHPEIDAVIVVCIKDWIPYMEELKYTYRLEKIASIVPGGSTGQMSIYNGLAEAARLYGRDGHIVLIHDGVRPLIDADLVTRNLRCVEENGSSISCGPVSETVVLVGDGEEVREIVNRKNSRVAKAPQGYMLADVLSVQEQAIREGVTDAIDTCTLMRQYNRHLSIVNCGADNVKITTPEDFFMFRAVADARENEQLG